MALGVFEQLFRCVRVAVEYGVFAEGAKGWVNVVVEGEGACVDNAHVHASLNGVILGGKREEEGRERVRKKYEKKKSDVQYMKIWKQYTK